MKNSFVLWWRMVSDNEKGNSLKSLLVVIFFGWSRIALWPLSSVVPELVSNNSLFSEDIKNNHHFKRFEEESGQLWSLFNRISISKSILKNSNFQEPKSNSIINEFHLQEEYFILISPFNLKNHFDSNPGILSKDSFARYEESSFKIFSY